MQRILNVFARADDASPEDLAGGAVVVIDVLRASTTIVHALEAGAIEVIPCLEVEDARRRAAELSASEVVLGGERQGLPIEGFDLGNSPTEYTVEAVGKRRVVFTTTNGTRAMQKCKGAGRVLIGAFVNAAAVCGKLISDGSRSIHLLCAGTRGRVSQDDVLLAGLLVHRLRRDGDGPFQLSDAALAAEQGWVDLFAQSESDGVENLEPELLAAELAGTIAGQNVVSIGRQDDILTASQLDRFRFVPELDVEKFCIRRK